MRGKSQNRTLPLAAGLLLAALTLGLKASAEPSWLPGADAHRAEEHGATCSVLRQIQSDNRKIASESQTLLETQITTLKSQRETLVRCAKEKGLPLNRGDLTETAMAEFCGPHFAMWVHQGYQLEMVRQDLTQATKDLDWVTNRLISACPGPKPGTIPTKSAKQEPGGGFLLARRKGEEAGRRRKQMAPIRTAWLRGSELPQ